MRLSAGFAGLSVALGMATPAATEPRQPTGKWVLSFADGQCVAMRDYGPADAPSSLLIKASPLGTAMQLSVMRQAQGPTDPKEQGVTLRFGENSPFKTKLLSYMIGETGTHAMRINLSNEDFAPLRQAKSMSIASGDEIDDSFALGPMDKLAAAMDNCLKDIQVYWNIDEGPAARLRSRAESKHNLAAYLADGDYPDVAIRKESDGEVGFVLLVDDSGRVADCMVTETSEVPILDAQACALLSKRARFTPAVGADGKPARDWVKARIRWRIPNRGTRIDE
ncbi:energy transducer TonB [Sphingosinicella rhizophila]|uniref:Energy transducer TonB n=1 Tax=Sphingosinicella rhizophila TaxID=3050082 RepID=A0ABU3Q9H6_9SPHN|nr:energy transducer TonB [Sphingosinicella sp. GR2756]MDT9600056.1 energy transducer TonB [Sphingosinicella sp. GR2756]